MQEKSEVSHACGGSRMKACIMRTAQYTAASAMLAHITNDVSLLSLGHLAVLHMHFLQWGICMCDQIANI